MDIERLRRSFVGQIAPDLEDYAAPGVDLVALARGNLNYLLRTPRPHMGYACRFGNFLSACPPHRGGEDLIANGDSDCRMDWQYVPMRQMTGRRDQLEVDAGVHQRVMGYLHADGLAWAPGAFYCGGEPQGDRDYISPWTTGKILYSLADRYARSGEPATRARARQVFERLRELAKVRDGKAWFEGGSGPYLDGRWYATFVTGNYGIASEPVLHYARCCHDDEALDFAVQFARGSMAGMQQNLGPRRIRADGSFTDHTHLHTHEVWGVADVAAHIGDAAMLDWAGRVYQFVRSRGGDSGFFPERMILPGESCWDGMHDRAHVSETCITGDMVAIALCLARAGRYDYFDHAERYLRNYLRGVQFRLTPRVEEWYRQRHRERPQAEVEAGLEMLRRDYDGAFLGHVGMSDWLHDAASVPQLAMVGCCAPEGMRALHAVWSAAATQDGDQVRIDMHFDRDLPAVTVRTSVGGTGRVEVQVKQPVRSLAIRLPAWTDRSGVDLMVDDRPVPRERFDAADAGVRLNRLAAGQRVELTYPLPRFVQAFQWGGRPDAPRLGTFHWIGNSIVAARAERGAEFPMYPPPVPAG